jgi:hypothetical protein
MKPSPTASIQKQLATFCELVKEIDLLASRQSAAETELATLTESGDICDDKILDRIGRLQLFTKLFPDRLEGREESIVEVKQSLVTALDDFFGNDIRRRFPNLQQLAYAQLEPQLKKHFRSESELRNAINNSEQMSEVITYGNSLSGCNTVGLMRREHAATIALGKKALMLWKQGEELEAKLTAKT